MMSTGFFYKPSVWTTEFDLKKGKPPGGFHLKKEETPTISLENPDKRWKPPGGFPLVQTQWSIR